MDKMSIDNIPEINIEQDKYDLYDRNIRLWGKDNQGKLNNSHILLINLTCAITELGKNLLLAGINLYLYDKDNSGKKRLVTKDDINSNFFLSSQDLNKERITILQETLSTINTYTSIKEIESLDKLDDVQCVCSGFSNFEKLVTNVLLIFIDSKRRFFLQKKYTFLFH